MLIKNKFILTIICIVLAPLAWADNYPTTAAEIIKALSRSSSSSSPWQRKSYNKDKKIGDWKPDIPTVIAPIDFKYNSSTIKSQSYPLLKQYAKALKTGLRDAKIEIGGHTDSKGSWGYNKSLSKRRANAVKRFLISQRVSSQQLKVIGYGEDKPIATNSTDSGRAKNRRVEFKLVN
jgi:outer membrane protein OmpA-like peptidoglycan-associated protein